MRKLWDVCAVYMLYLIFIYLAKVHFEIPVVVERTGFARLAHMVVFLLVFRLNQCMKRHCKGNRLTADIFADAEVLMRTFCSALLTPAKLTDEATAVDKSRTILHAEMNVLGKVNVIRLTLALALAQVTHLWMLDACAVSQGKLEGDQLANVVCLLTRLEGLLYPEELHIVEEAISIIRSDRSLGAEVAHQISELGHQGQRGFSGATSYPIRLATFIADSVAADSGEGPHFQAEVNRHRLLDAEGGTYGAANALEKSVVPLPKMLSQLLLDTLVLHSTVPWGYDPRLLSFMVTKVQQQAVMLEQLARIVAQPLPLAYLQHCRVLLTIYALCSPFSVDRALGVMENILIPLVIFTRLHGFDVLAAEMENPLGLEEMDLNLLDMVHGLEVSAQHAFDLSQSSSKVATRSALCRVTKDFDLDQGAVAFMQKKTDEAAEQSSPFDRYFHWSPMPTLVLAPMTESHGHVTDVHQAQVHGGGLRHLLRRSLVRWRARTHEGSEYQPLDVQSSSSLVAPLAATDDAADRLDEVRRDPMIWCHFLALRRKADHLRGGGCTDCQAFDRPVSHRLLTLLQGSDVRHLVSAEGAENETERSAENYFGIVHKSPSELFVMSESEPINLHRDVETANAGRQLFTAALA